MNFQARKPSAKVEKSTILKSSQSEVLKIASISKKIGLQMVEGKLTSNLEHVLQEKTKDALNLGSKPFDPLAMLAKLSRSKERVSTPKKASTIQASKVSKPENFRKPEELKRTITKDELLANLKAEAKKKSKRVLPSSKENFMNGYLTNSSEFEESNQDAKSSKEGTASGSTSMSRKRIPISGQGNLSTESVLFSDDLMCSDANAEEITKETKPNEEEGFEIDMIYTMISKEASYSADPHYFSKTQRQVNWTMRAILMDWMMEVSTEFTMKRETFHLAANYVDRFLSSVPISKLQLQLVGVTALYIAAKMEEIYPPRISDFSKSTDNGYSANNIQDMEISMLKGLNFKLAPSTVSTWVSWYSSQWDVFIDQCENFPFPISTVEEIKFRSPNENSYKLFRELYQILDIAILDVKTLQYKPRLLIASVMYLVIGKKLDQFSESEISKSFVNCSFVDLDIQIPFNQFFYSYLLPAFGFNLMDLIPYIQFCSTFFVLPIEFDLPKAAKINKEAVLEVFHFYQGSL